MILNRDTSFEFNVKTKVKRCVINYGVMGFRTSVSGSLTASAYSVPK